MPKAEQNTSALCLSPSQCGLLIPGSGTKASLFLCLPGVYSPKLCQAVRQMPAVIELGQKKVMKAQEFGWEGEETACASAGLHSVPAHTAALQGAGSLAPTNTAVRGELVPA